MVLCGDYLVGPGRSDTCLGVLHNEQATEDTQGETGVSDSTGHEDA